jgi:hypothetical protein
MSQLDKATQALVNLRKKKAGCVHRMDNSMLGKNPQRQGSRDA